MNAEFLNPRRWCLTLPSVLAAAAIAITTATGANAQSEEAEGKPEAAAEEAAPPKRPNILIVLLDDVGYTGFGAFGGDTATPNIDRLGKAGVLLSRYYSLPLCGPSRASMLTGQDNHLVGSGTLGEALTEEMQQLPAYSMTWNDDQKTIATRLKGAGYQTFATGKWGVGRVGVNLPNRFGFDRSWVLDATGSSNYEAKSYIPNYTEVKWFEDGKRVQLPADFYSSRNIVDKMIQYVDGADPDRPFFGFLSFQAVHVPVQAPLEFINKYNGTFDRGWDVLREERLKRVKELGLVPEGTKLAEAPHESRKWNDLDAEQKAYWARMMQVEAGMMEAADHHLGRLLDHLKAKGQFDNTLVIVTSDNGPDYNTIGTTSKGGLLAFERFWMSLERWDTDYENLGQPGSLAAMGKEWASVSAAPFHLFKFTAAEGGVRVPMIIAGPGVKPRGVVGGRSFVADIAPTLLDVAGVSYAPDEFHGRSWMRMLSGEADEVYGEADPIMIEVSGTVGLYRGNWKLTKTPRPYGDGAWHLYDITQDPGETNDLAGQQTELVEQMQSEYRRYAEQVGVYELGPNENAKDQIAANALKKFSVNYWYVLVSAFVCLLAVIFGAIWLGRVLLLGRPMSISRSP